MREFFTEDNERLSMMRLLSFCAFIAAFGFGVAAIYCSSEIADSLSSQFLLAAFGGKAIQKHLESN